MPTQKLRVLAIVVLVFAIVISTHISLVSSSTGYIRINGKSASVPSQQVQAGGNVSLYFGEVTWSGTNLFLFLSRDSNPQISSGDFVYTPRFSIANLTNTATQSTYTDANRAWVIGSNWINGSIPTTVPIGNFAIKAFDEVAATVAVTDTFIVVYSSVVSASLQVSPSSGPGGVPVQFSGSGYPANSLVTISYYDSKFSSWNYLGSATADSLGAIRLNSTVPDLRRSLGSGSLSETYTKISYRSEINGIVYGYADYNQYSRGLKRVGNQTASGLYGNGTNLVSTVKVRSDDTLMISGKWFRPGVVYVRWDGAAVVGTVTGDQWRNAVIVGTSVANSQGSFEASVTIPTADAGDHYLAVEDSETIVIIKVFVSRGSLQVSPSSGPGGINVQFTGSGYPASATVTISYSDSKFGTWFVWGTTTSDSSGRITLTAEMPDLRRSLGSYDSSETSAAISFRAESGGVVYSYADYNQYFRGLKKVGSQTARGLYGNGTNLASNITVKAGDTITISGKWFHPGVIYVRWDGVAVVGTVTGDQWRNAVIVGTSAASSSGSFETSITVPAANGGEHYVAIEDSETILIVKVNANGPNATVSPTPTSPNATPPFTPSPTFTAGPTPTSSPNPTPTPAPTPSQSATVAVSCRSTTTYSGLRVEVFGTLAFNGTAASEEPVLISYSVTSGGYWVDLTSVETGAAGDFFAVWTPSVTGNYLIKAKWQGNSTIAEGSAVVNLALTYSERNVFSVASNSTISEFAFNSATQELSFVASGPSGTTGHVSVCIPKSLIGEIANLRIYLDGNQRTYTRESQNDSWVISFSYPHSTHRIVIELSGAPAGFSLMSTEVLAICVVAVVAVAIAVTFVVRKRRRANTTKMFIQMG